MTAEPAPRAPAQKTGRAALIALAAALALGAALRFSFLSGPVGGYHSMNEAWYISMASNFDRVSLFTPTAGTGDVDHKVRALYVYAAYAAFKVMGPGAAAARAVSAAAGAASILLMFLIGARMFSARAGVAAAVLLAVSPIHVLLSRNAQPDALAACLTLLAVLLYLRADAPRAAARLALAGLAWGAAVFTKNFALLVIAPIVLHELLRYGITRRAAARLAWFLAPALLVPAPFLLYQLAHNPAGMVNLYRDIVLSAPDAPMLNYMFLEAAWALCPVVFAIAFGGLAWLIAKRFRTAALAWGAAAVFCAQYFFQHVHSYYFLSATPFLVLCAGAALGALPRRTGAILGALAAGSSLAFTVLCYAAVKHNDARFTQTAAIVAAGSRDGAALATGPVFHNYGPALQFYLPGRAVLKIEALETDPHTGRVIVPGPQPWHIVGFAPRGGSADARFERTVSHTLYGLCASGRVFAMLPRGTHSFIPARFASAPRPRGARCPGIAPFAAMDSLRISRVPRGAQIFRLERNGEISYTIGHSRPAPQ